MAIFLGFVLLYVLIRFGLTPIGGLLIIAAIIYESL